MAISSSATLFIFAFFLFLFVLMALDIAMIVSLLKTGDERRQLIVWKASTGTLLIVVLSLVIQIAESIVRSQAMETNPFITLSIAAVTLSVQGDARPLYTKGIYFAELLYYKKRYSC